MYQCLPDPSIGVSQCVKRLFDNAFIPFAVDNTDYINFKKDLANGVELQDADGNVIDGMEYLKELP
jgi:hypothetical protein